ncbi:MAG: hypothetical protein FJ280_26680, partial [Planctomycetes bacterium]|nr:hypothetical protein [Planctomycetota bacterium]
MWRPVEMYMLLAAERISHTHVRRGCPVHPVPSRVRKAPFSLRAGVGLWCLLLLAGCTSQVKTEKSVTLEKPQVKNGVILEEDDPAKLQELAAALEALDLTVPDAKATLAPGAAAPSPAAAAEALPPRISVTDAVEMTARPGVPADATKLIPLAKLSRTEVNEIVEHLVLSLGSELGYAGAATALAEALPPAPPGVIDGRTLTRAADNGTHVLRLGYRYFVSQPPQFWALGVIVGKDGALSANPDLAKVEPKITTVLASLQEMRAGLTARDMEARLIQLSYVDAVTALNTLKGFGVTTVGKAADVPAKMEFANLPCVVCIEDPKKEYTGLVGAKTKIDASTAAVKLSMAPGVAAELEDNTIASPMTQLLVLFHPAHPEQFSEVRRILDTVIDRPARQIFIEAMVLEISADGLKELGVEWELDDPPLAITAGSLRAGASTQTLDIQARDITQLGDVLRGEYGWNWDVTLRALVRSGKAEILSRPSVLTLDNRQSTIRVGEDIPIASSLEGFTVATNRVSFKFDYLPTGILLNVRPRINESGAEVSMLIDTIVSARVPNADLVMRSGDGTILAAAPTISTRRVQTYGRIPNNTPLIIGGLVAREEMV